MTATRSYPITYAYLRFSSDAQADGDSFDRQRERVEKRLAELNIQAAEVKWLEDPGYSAFHGEHVRLGKMGDFLNGLRKGVIRDCLFVCESVSRLSRQGAFATVEALNLMLEAGCSIWFLSNGHGPFNKSNMPRFVAVEIALLAELAREESQQKSDYASRNWAKKRRAAREEGALFTSQCPMWLEVKDEEYVPIASRVTAIKDLFAKARDGWGISRLVRYANTQRLEAPGKEGSWHLSLIKRVLTNRALIGEFQPHQDAGNKRLPVGAPIANYYPAVIDTDLFYAVQGIRAKASKFPKRRDENNYNYLMGLAKCGCGGAWRRMNKNSGAQEGYALYGCSNRQRSHTNCPNVNARTFDFQFVGFACEKLPVALANHEDPNKERVLSLRGQIGEVRAKREKMISFVEDNPDLSDDFADRLRKLKSDERELMVALDVLEAEAPPPPGFTFGERVEVFLPAYLDVFQADSEAAQDAYRIRSLFRTHLVEVLKSIEVAADRTKLTATLKNGQVISVDIEPKMEFSLVTEPGEIEALDAERSASLRRTRHFRVAESVA